jgi:hypothetical protein
VNGTGDARNVDRSRPRGAHPRGLGLVLLTAFLTAATVPALHSWVRRNQERQLQNRQGRLERLLQAGSEDRRDALPERDPGNATDGTSRSAGRTARHSVVVPVGARRSLEDTLVSPPSTVELFRAKGLREGEFERSLKPPATVTCSATRDGIDVRWERPADLDAQLALLRGDRPAELARYLRGLALSPGARAVRQGLYGVARDRLAAGDPTTARAIADALARAAPSSDEARRAAGLLGRDDDLTDVR